MATQTVCQHCGTSFVSNETEPTRSNQCPNCGQNLTPKPPDPPPTSQLKNPSFTLFGVDLQPGWKSFILIQVVAFIIWMLLYLITVSLASASNGNPVGSFFSYVLFGISLIISLWYIPLGLYTLFAKPPVLPEWIKGMAETFQNSRERLREKDGYFVKYYGRPMIFLLDGVMQTTSRISDPFSRASSRIILVQLALSLGFLIWMVVAQISIMLSIIFIIIWIWANHNNTGSNSSSGSYRRRENENPPGRQPGGTSKPERNIFTGEETIVHRDQQGQKVATTQKKTEFITGEKIMVDKDLAGNVIGRSKNEQEWFTGDRVQVHRDTEGNVAGTTRQETEFFTGQRVDVHRDNDGKVTGKSTDETEFFTGDEFKQHRDP